MRIVLDFLFPKYLARLSYFVRAVLCEGVLLYLYQDPWGETPSGIVALLAGLLYMSVFILLPRIRDIGMSAWWMVLAFIPYVSSFLSVALLFRRTNPLHNPLFQSSAVGSISPRPDPALGSPGD